MTYAALADACWWIGVTIALLGVVTLFVEMDDDGHA